MLSVASCPRSPIAIARCISSGSSRLTSAPWLISLAESSSITTGIRIWALLCVSPPSIPGRLSITATTEPISTPRNLTGAPTRRPLTSLLK